MRSPASYTLDSTGETGTFGVDVLWWETGSNKTVTINFISDTTAQAFAYREQFMGSIVANTIAGAILPLSASNAASPLDTLASASLTLTRQ